VCLKMQGNLLLILFATFCGQVFSTPFVVQSLSSNYGIVLGGYGPGYKELREVEVVKHDKICSGVIKDVPTESGRFLGDISGMAEYLNGSVIFCRHKSCWRLDVARNSWSKVGGFKTIRDRAASLTVGDQMLVLGGRDPTGSDLISFEVYDDERRSWKAVPEWEMAQGRYSFCSVPVNETAMLIIGGYSQEGPLSSVELLDIKSGRWERLPDLPQPRYGHACLLMELAGQEGVLVSGGALTGSDVDFLNIKTQKWTSLPPLMYRTDGHKMVLIEGIPTLFSWEHIEQFDGSKWVNADLKLSQSRSAFAVTTIPGHLVRGCL